MVDKSTSIDSGAASLLPWAEKRRPTGAVPMPEARRPCFAGSTSGFNVNPSSGKTSNLNAWEADEWV